MVSSTRSVGQTPHGHTQVEPLENPDPQVRYAATFWPPAVFRAGTYEDEQCLFFMDWAKARKDNSSRKNTAGSSTIFSTHRGDHEVPFVRCPFGYLVTCCLF
jgi:hypothetical protein